MDKAIALLTDPLVLPVTVCMLAGALAYVLSRPAAGICRVLGVVGSAAALAAGIHAAAVDVPPLREVWIDLPAGVTFAFELAPSAPGLLVAIGSAAFGLLVAVYSLRSMAGNHWEGKFHAYLLWAVGGAAMVGLAGNLLVLLVGWEIVTLMLFLMINQGPRDAPAAGAKAYGMLGFADACLLLAVALLAAAGGGTDALSLTAGPRAVSELGATGYVVYLLLMVAALAKAGAMPLHTWIPSAAKDAPVSVMALLPAALDKLLGIYLLATVALRMFRPDGAMQVVMMAVGAVTILAAVLMAMMQHNLKRLLAFHAVSQVGYMVLGIGTGTAAGVIGGLFHMLNNAIYKSDLFLVSGVVERASGTDEIEQMGSLARYLPLTFTSALVAAAAISGIPPLNGFASKWLVYHGTLGVAPRGLAVAVVTVAVFGSALTLASFVKVIHSAFLSPAPPAQSAAMAARPPRESFVQAAPMVLLAVACIALGLAPQAAVEGLFAGVAAEAGLEGLPAVGGAGAAEAGLWNPASATVLILIGLGLGALLRWLATRPAKVRVVRPFLGGEVPAAGDGRFRVPGTHFYQTIARLPGLGPLLAHGQAGAMDLYHWSGKHGRGIVDVLRAQHTGLLSLYVAWVVIGLTVTLAYLLIASGT